MRDCGKALLPSSMGAAHPTPGVNRIEDTTPASEITPTIPSPEGVTVAPKDGPTAEEVVAIGWDHCPAWRTVAASARAEFGW